MKGASQAEAPNLSVGTPTRLEKAPFRGGCFVRSRSM